jgi:hypothetical protein
VPFIDPEVERPAREMLGQAISGELDELETLIQSIGGDQYGRVLGMCLAAAAYVAVDVSGRWPTDADLREIARLVEEHDVELLLDRVDVYHYLADAALGFQRLSEALDDGTGNVALPVLITASMLFTFCPNDHEWETYLDQIWSAYDTAQNVELSVLPALHVRTHMHKALSGRGTLGRLPTSWSSG